MCGEEQVNGIYHQEKLTNTRVAEGIRKADVTSVTKKVISVVIDVAQREVRIVRSAIK